MEYDDNASHQMSRVLYDEDRPMLAALDSFRQFRKVAHFNVTHRRRQNFYALPSAQWQMLAGAPFNILKTLDDVDEAIDVNADIAERIFDAGLRHTGLNLAASTKDTTWVNTATASDIDKARSTIRQFYRDWSAEGSAERQQAYHPVLQDLHAAFSAIQDKSVIKVLVPGAGLGRLDFEICKRGYSVWANEFSNHQLLARKFIRKALGPKEQFNLYPFALDFSNHLRRADQLKVVQIPDVHPCLELRRTKALHRWELIKGDFVVQFGAERYKEKFDVVVTVFFVDTAPNVLKYIEAVRNCLREGGLWINLGPLLWHFGERRPSQLRWQDENSEHNHTRKKDEPFGIEAPGSVELTNEELLLLVEKMGFGIDRQEIRTEGAGYMQNPESMLQNMYNVSHWVATKKIDWVEGRAAGRHI